MTIISFITVYLSTKLPLFYYLIAISQYTYIEGGKIYHGRTIKAGNTTENER